VVDVEAGAMFGGRKKSFSLVLVWKSLRFHVKTEENPVRLLSPSCPSLSGNKRRKLKYFLQKSPAYLSHVSHDHHLPIVMISYGGLQSNSMFAISLLAQQQTLDCEFIYFVRRYPKYLQSKPVGNLERALRSGMTLIELGSDYKRLQDIPKSLHAFPREEFKKYLSNDILKSNILWIPQGGALPEAEIGIQELCHEIFLSIQSFPDQSQSWKIFVSSGTGTTALFMARGLSTFLPISRCEVIAIPCVGTRDDLLNQMKALSSMTPHGATSEIFPTILPIPSTYHPTPFAHPSRRHLEAWSSLNQSARSQDPLTPLFDLIYAPKAFELIEESYRHFQETKEWVNGARDEFAAIWEGYERKSCQLLYYHCGGAEGNESQLQRYGPADVVCHQLPGVNNEMFLTSSSLR
jgi:1-aminocyclopropane-1-carboxylate deaminase